ncbi:response regulator [Flavobacteriaceae bacterium]|nr:response regulator [Flavobacteriaceae bacterium]MDA8762891.1 response regulator [Flavobacteriaceae bacterium]
MRKIEVLIVDDEIDNSDLLKHFIEQYCPTISKIEVANDYETAVEMIQKNNYDLLFLDIVLDDNTAFDILKKLENQPFIIFVTAYDMYAIDSFKYNTIDYILKPIQIQSLIKAVERVMDRLENKEGANYQYSIRA